MVNLPVDDMDAIAPRWRERTAQTLDNRRPGARSAPELLRFMLAHCCELNDDSRERLAGTTLSLLGQLLADRDEARAEPSPQQSRLTAYHRQRIEHFILEHLRDPDLSVNAIAQALHLSVRYVHKLFVGQPVMQWAMAQRLRACQRELATRGARSICDVAYAWGFNSPAHFSRLFKKHFGVCPSDV
jgi:AraC-like DNA-binding protein